MLNVVFLVHVVSQKEKCAKDLFCWCRDGIDRDGIDSRARRSLPSHCREVPSHVALP